ncbi:MAG TPA: ABC transporter permease [Clostridia bacterium]|nr:ABC transporter permease [Clostridia bacterium]
MKKWLYNPVMVSELKIKMRGWRTAAAVTVYLGIMLLISYLFFNLTFDNTYGYGNTFDVNNSIGLQIYTTLAILQFALIVLITPAQTAGSISGEREKQTLDLLLCTKMSPTGIVMGKLISSMSFIFLLIISSIPIFSLALLFGGVTPGDIVVLFAFYMITAFAIGSIGMFCSVLFKKTVTSTVISYLTIFVLGILTAIIGATMLQSYYYNSSSVSGMTLDSYTPFVFYLNPVTGLADILARQSGSGGNLGVAGVLSMMFGMGYYGTSNPNTGGMINGWSWSQWSLWIRNAVIMLSAAGTLLTISAWKIKPVRRGFRKKHLANISK